MNGIRSIKYDKNNVKIKIGYDASCGLCAPRYETYLIPIKKVNVDEIMHVLQKYFNNFQIASFEDDSLNDEIGLGFYKVY